MSKAKFNNKNLDVSESGRIVSRIYITESGDLVVTDLWEEIKALLASQDGGFEIEDSNL